MALVLIKIFQAYVSKLGLLFLEPLKSVRETWKSPVHKLYLIGNACLWVKFAASDNPSVRIRLGSVGLLDSREKYSVWMCLTSAVGEKVGTLRKNADARLQVDLKKRLRDWGSWLSPGLRSSEAFPDRSFWPASAPSPPSPQPSGLSFFFLQF